MPFKAYIYCTKGKDGYEWLYRVDNNEYGKVIGEFICDKVERFTVGSLRSDDIEQLACLSYNEMISYFYKPEELDGKTVKQGFAWHISDLKIYDKPKELSEFRKPFIDYVSLKESIMVNPKIGISEYVTCPPQSWIYVEEQNE